MAREGISEDFIPDILDLSLVDEALHIEDRDAFIAARELLIARKHARRFVHRHPHRRGSRILSRAGRAQDRRGVHL